jgi:hypothetical protein
MGHSDFRIRLRLALQRVTEEADYPLSDRQALLLEDAIASALDEVVVLVGEAREVTAQEVQDLFVAYLERS